MIKRWQRQRKLDVLFVPYPNSHAISDIYVFAKYPFKLHFSTFLLTVIINIYSAVKKSVVVVNCDI